MLRLFLLRHAKSSWDDDNLDDAARPLNTRGREAAKAMGHMMADRKLLPDLVLCSPAVRAAETWHLVSGAFDAPIPSRTIADLYDFGDGGNTLDVIRALGKQTPRLMLVGHNPAIESLAARLIGSGGSALRERLAAKYPTGALTIISFPIVDWRQLAEGAGTITHFIRPRDLQG